MATHKSAIGGLVNPYQVAGGGSANEGQRVVRHFYEEQVLT